MSDRAPHPLRYEEIVNIMDRCSAYVTVSVNLTRNGCIEGKGGSSEFNLANILRSRHPMWTDNVRTVGKRERHSSAQGFLVVEFFVKSEFLSDDVRGGGQDHA